MKKTFLIVGLIALAGCVSGKAEVASKNSAGITYITPKGTAPVIALSMTQTQASRHCGSMGKSSQYMDTRVLRDGSTEHYYRCY